LASLSNLVLYSGSYSSLYASSAGTYDLSSVNSSDDFDLYAQSNGGTTLIGNGASEEWLTASSSGTDTLEAGSGEDTLFAGAGSNTLKAGSGNDTLYGGNGYDTYQFGSSFGNDTINNVYSGSRTTASGEVDFLSGTTDENLWFQQSGNNLVVDLLDTSDKVTISNFFGGNAGAQVESFNANGLTLDSQLSSLVSAMATYATNNPGFNPVTATSMPTDTTLQSAIAASWHA
jgi:Ca2+-binding RTX toxin-like protein